MTFRNIFLESLGYYTCRRTDKVTILSMILQNLLVNKNFLCLLKKSESKNFNIHVFTN